MLVHWVQTVLPAKLPQISDGHPLAFWVDEPCLRQRKALPAIGMGPAAMTADPAMRNCDHVSVVQPMLPTEGGEVGNRSDRLAVWVDEAFIGLDILPLASTIPMR